MKGREIDLEQRDEYSDPFSESVKSQSVPLLFLTSLRHFIAGADPSAPWSTHRSGTHTQPALNKVASGYEYQAITNNKSETNTTARQAHRRLSNFFQPFKSCPLDPRYTLTEHHWQRGPGPQIGYDTWVVYQVSAMLLETISHLDANYTLMAKVARLH
ncbi:unnamed protein product [Fusarium graminearum]|nr:unnamed protein product [Fusarium graminearum]